MTEVSVLGAGRVGTCVGRGLIQLHHNVKFYDISTARANELRTNGLPATSSLESALSGSAVSIVCIPTPTVRGAIDLSYLRSIVSELANWLKDKTDYHLIAIKSTVVPRGAAKSLFSELILLSKEQLLNEFSIASCHIG